jgi:hypothetical protein
MRRRVGSKRKKWLAVPVGAIDESDQFFGVKVGRVTSVRIVDLLPALAIERAAFPEAY